MLSYNQTFLCVFLTLAGGEKGAPRIAPNTHHQRVSDQVVALITLELQSASCVQVVFLHFAVQDVFWAVAAFHRWHERQWQEMKWHELSNKQKLRAMVNDDLDHFPYIHM